MGEISGRDIWGDIGTIFVGHLFKERPTMRLATLMTGYD